MNHRLPASEPDRARQPRVAACDGFLQRKILWAHPFVSFADILLPQRHLPLRALRARERGPYPEQARTIALFVFSEKAPNLLLWCRHQTLPSALVHRPTEYRIGQIDGAGKLIPQFADELLYLGGDVGRNTMHLLHSALTEPERTNKAQSAPRLCVRARVPGDPRPRSPSRPLCACCCREKELTTCLSNLQSSTFHSYRIRV